MHHASRNLIGLFIIGLVLTGWCVVGSLLSTRFAYDLATIDLPVRRLTLTMVLMGVTYLALFSRGILNAKPTMKTMSGVVLLGLVMRMVFIPSTPMLEDDVHRYLWDGAMTANRINPYLFTPESALDPLTAGSKEILDLAIDSGPIVERINHGHLRTIYPPLTQAAFALAYWFNPWSEAAWRLTCLLFDTAGLFLLVALLREMKRPPLYALIYWWNPLFIKETYNSGHMDVLLVPFLLATLLTCVRNRPVQAGIMLGLATAIKIWPVLLVPLLLKSFYPSKTRCLASGAAYAVTSIGLLAPVALWGLGPDSGFTSYARIWEMNDALYMILYWAMNGLVTILGLDSVNGHVITRIAIGGLLGVFSIYLAWKSPTGLKSSSGFWLALVSALFFLSPSQFPWYFTWVLPFLALHPRFSLALLTALMPLYYLRFYFRYFDQQAWFDYGVVWLEYLPVFLLLVREWWKDRCTKTRLT